MNQTEEDPKEILDDPKFKKNKEEAINAMKESPLIRKIANFFYRSYMIANPGIWKLAIKSKNFRTFLLNREKRTGLLEGSIIQNPLYIPNEEGIEKRQVLAGQWAGYDFKRKKEFGNKVEQYRKGKLLTFLIDEIRDNNSEDYTPTISDVLFNINHLIHIEIPSIDYCLENGIIRDTTYLKTYEQAKMDKNYLNELERFGVLNNSVYQVTPKGNSLIYLVGSGGEKQEGESREFSFEKLLPIFNN